MVSRSATTLSESRLAPAWAELRARGRTALIPYLTAGYPTSESSLAALRAARSEETGQAWVCQPGREPLKFNFPNVPGPRVEGAEGMVPQL